MSETQDKPINQSTPTPDAGQTKSGNFLQNWKFKAGLISTAVVSIFLGLFLLVFFWHHIVAGMGMSSWSSRAGAEPIECMMKDTNDDGYVSCSAMLKGEVVPLECGVSVFNIGCRVNYGAAAAPTLRSFPAPR
ncbi:MAG: hypothetical protein RIM23_16720 [Coleofasciculus sp. G3-WIS-01]|uniref:hypothetical protein n=1 Tax=Coleofasciculus sp. G3-WIS-01 TaxID=3069528 RepID=UPI0032FA47E5